jgi:beta-N-acetylhexosaminidase
MSFNFHKFCRGFAILALPLFLSTQAQPVKQHVAVTAVQDPDEILLKKMTLEQKVGQLFIFGYMGTEAKHSLTEIVEKLHPGGILVFGRNIHTAKQTAKMLYEAQTASIAHSHIPLLVAVDQEGGDVIRIKTSPPLPSALALGEAGDLELVHEAGLQTALLLKALGFNMNLAPVLDISDPLKDSFIGTRAFGKTPETVSKMGLEFGDGLRDGGVLPTAKHFPGHGGIKGDSHLLTPQKNVSLDFLLNNDLLPYSELTRRGGANAIMVAHIAFPKIDSTMTPATYSKTLINEVLRQRIGFDGIVMTDDIEMGGAGAGSPTEHAKRAINAGVDLVMMAWNKKMQFKVVRSVIEAVRKEEIDPARIDESVLRILRIKRQFASFEKPVLPNAKKFLNIVRGHGIQSVSQKIIVKIFDS